MQVEDESLCDYQNKMWVKFGEYNELLHGRRFSLRLKRVVYESYARPAILYGCEAWCLNESEMGILRRSEASIVRAMCGVLLKEKGLQI